MWASFTMHQAYKLSQFIRITNNRSIQYCLLWKGTVVCKCERLYQLYESSWVGWLWGRNKGNYCCCGKSLVKKQKQPWMPRSRILNLLIENQAQLKASKSLDSPCSFFLFCVTNGITITYPERRIYPPIARPIHIRLPLIPAEPYLLFMNIQPATAATNITAPNIVLTSIHSYGFRLLTLFL